MTVRLLTGDCRDLMATLDADSIDCVVTDPPAGISFMGRSWDSDKGGRDAWVTWLTDVLREAYRVAKPGAHAVVWALPRTSGWTHRALEDAGWIFRLSTSRYPADESLAIVPCSRTSRWRYDAVL